jgi:uncharacterized protein (TIGR02301 family)
MRATWGYVLVRLNHGGGFALRPPHRRRISRAELPQVSMLVRALTFLWIALSAAAGVARGAESGGSAYETDMLRLAEILGALHYLRAICGANEGQTWRNDMQALIDAEAPNGERRDRLIAGFNRGYRGFQQSYRSCTPAADLAIRRYLEEGARIARDITARYAN